jgi:hypothetical protein
MAARATRTAQDSDFELRVSTSDFPLIFPTKQRGNGPLRRCALKHTQRTPRLLLMTTSRHGIKFPLARDIDLRWSIATKKPM